MSTDRAMRCTAFQTEYGIVSGPGAEEGEQDARAVETSSGESSKQSP